VPGWQLKPGWTECQSSCLNTTRRHVMCQRFQPLLDRLDIADVSVLLSTVRIHQSACNLGMVIDSRLSLSEHVESVCQSDYYQLRKLCQAIRCSSVDATRTMVQAFITSRLDWCNTLYYGITDELMRCLHLVQNAAGRLITGSRRRDTSSVLRQLHWLAARQRVKNATLVHWSLSSHIPS